MKYIWKLRAKLLRLSFNSVLFKEPVVHWGENILPLIISKDLVERLLVLILCEGRKELLGVLHLLAGTGEKQAENIFRLLIDWVITNSIVAVYYVTTI